MVSLEFTAQQLHDLLEQLRSRVAERGGRTRMVVVGGAALALAGDERRVTRDVDVLPDAQDRVIIMAEAAAMAGEQGLPMLWLNDSVRAFSPPIPASDRVRTDIAGVDLASDRILAAMKLVAFRVTDLADLERLFERLGIRSAEEAADLTVEVYGPDHFCLPERGELFLCATAILKRRETRT